MADILVSKAGRVTTVTLNRPQAMNAITPDMHHALQDAFDAFAADEEQFICVVTGAGERAFCAGSDLKAVAQGDFYRAYPKNGYAGLIERFDCDKPIIAAVNGLALGGGFEIALACDLIIASETASFGLPEPRVGAIAIGGGVHRLARQIGLKRAMGYLFTCARISAQDGYALGLVNAVVAPERLAEETQAWCDDILKAAPLSIRATKQAAMRGLDEPSLAAAMQNQNDYPAYARWRTADDTREGPRAFAEKRAPNWTGR
ncbi:MAG: enoyl-CoA hydratase [Alphaproteobacteria bacterium]|nr:enoyl-CoA hydratase [Alphaproteobacteria bacterium]